VGDYYYFVFVLGGERLHRLELALCESPPILVRR
jgi:hypothetical protein